MAWDLSCRDWQERIRTGRSLVPDLPLLDNEAAERAVTVFNYLRLADVPGNPRLADAAGDWFRDIVRALFGSWDPVTKQRNIREIFALVAKKNSKTSYGAGLMLTALILNERPRGKFLLVAPTQDVTELAFGQAAGMIALDAHLSKNFKIQEHLKKITDMRDGTPGAGATLEVMSFDPNVLTGQKPTGFLVDELHVMSSSAKAISAVGQLRGGMIAQPEAFGLFVTTQSERPPSGVFRAELHRARAIRDGRQSGPLLPVLYEFPDDVAKDQAKWGNPTHWHMVAPNAGRSITIERLTEEFATAKQLGDEEVRRWASQHLNIESGIGMKSDRWPGADFWLSRADPTLTREALLDRSEVVIVGIDGGGLDDLFGLALLGRDRNTKHWLLWSHAWCHSGVLERRKSIASTLADFAKAGELSIVDDALGDISAIVEVVQEVKDRGLLGGVAVDPAGLGEFVDAMSGIDVTQDNKLLIGVGQGYRMMNAIKTAERRLAGGTLWHGGSGLMAWCVGNLKIEPTATAIRATKQNAGDAKIDPVMAAFDAIDIMSTNPEAVGSSYYQEHGLLVL
jgi:phage terminase large subunit-like protein